MNPRLNHAQQSPALAKKLMELGQAVATSIEPKLLDLINIRASQINGCAFCLDMHVKEAKLHGERELRVYHVSVWEESPLFSEKEKAALMWTEAVTKLTGKAISEEKYLFMLNHFSPKELSDLSYAIGSINFWNRLNACFTTKPGVLDEMFGLNKAGLN